MTPARNFLPEVGKPSAFAAAPTMSSNIPYIPSPSSHFSSILGPSTSMMSSSPPSILASSFPTQTIPLIPSPFSFSSNTNSFAAPPIYPANPLSSHLYGAATKASEQLKTHTTPAKQKVKFSDTVTQIVVPVSFLFQFVFLTNFLVKDISELSGGKPRRTKGVNPAQELADSLPLCLGNKDYLKDFAKAREEEEEMHGATIKVIHFGVV